MRNYIYLIFAITVSLLVACGKDERVVQNQASMISSLLKKYNNYEECGTYAESNSNNAEKTSMGRMACFSIYKGTVDRISWKNFHQCLLDKYENMVDDKSTESQIYRCGVETGEQFIADVYSVDFNPAKKMEMMLQEDQRQRKIAEELKRLDNEMDRLMR